MAWTQAQWRDNAQRLPAFLTPLVVELGRRERRAGAALYVEGLLLPGQRKSIEPMAERLGVDSQKLQQFITDSPWEEGAVWQAIRREVVGAIEPVAACEATICKPITDDLDMQRSIVEIVATQF